MFGGIIIKISEDSFLGFLDNEGYLFDKKIIENYLLSLKVKPFVILTGNSGTGKTQLSKLFAEYIDSTYLNEEYLNIKVKPNYSSWKNRGWTLDKSYFTEILPIRESELKCEIDIDKISAEGNISLSVQLFYESLDLKKYFKKLFDENQENGIVNPNEIPEVNLKINYNGINNLWDDYIIHEGSIILKQNSNKSAFKDRQWFMSNEFFKYIPFKSGYVECKIIVEDIESDAKLRIVPRLSFKKNNLLQNYLMKHDGSEVNVELKIDNFDYSNFSLDDHINERNNFSNLGGKNYKIIPIGANWTDNTNIIGYYNLIDETYHYPPAFEFIKMAKNDPESPYFLILDEMNLSHVERYFADFLSAIESKEGIPLNGCDKSLKLPKNLFIIGTVNVDETTYMFSPKVLDRANTIEFDTILASEYMQGLGHDFFEGDVSYLQSPLSDLEIYKWDVEELKDILSDISCEGGKLWDLLSKELTLFQKKLMGPGFDFGFRVINEILRFMVVSWKYEGSPKNWDNWERYFDAQIKQKILPKLHGSEKAIGKVLIDLFNLCLTDRDKNINPTNFDDFEKECRYPTSALKIQDMSRVLSDQRYVSFIN